jgi:hypothetical protein
MKWEILAVASLVIATLVYPAIAQSTVISIEDVDVALGGSATVPIYIYDVTDPDGVGTVQLALLYNASVVQITGTNDSNTDFSFVTPNIDNTNGILTVGGTHMGAAPGPTGDVRVIDVTFTAVGSAGEESLLDITATLLKDATVQQNDITHDVDDGYFTISEEEESIPPIVTNASVDPLVIPDDTDNEPRWGELAELMVNVTDESELASVTVNLSAIGGGSKEPMGNGLGVACMFNIGNYTVESTLWTVYNYSTNASEGTAGWNETLETYVPYCLPVNATDIYGNSNTSVCIELTVMKNGDVNEDGSVNFGDVTYLANHVVSTAGYESMEDGIAEVNGDTSVNFGDVTYLANHVVSTAGYEELK